MKIITSKQIAGFIFFIMMVSVAPVQAEVTYTMAIQKAGNGIVTSAPAGINCGSKCDYLFKQNLKVTLKATPAKGYQFTGWGGDCSTSPCKVTINDSKNITATFMPLPRLSVQKFGNGTVTSAPAGINCGSKCDYLFKQNLKVTLKATPAKGYEFVGWGDACSGGGLCLVNIKNNNLVMATFRETNAVPKADQTISFGATPIVRVNGTGSLSAIASSGLPVTYTSGTFSICTVSGSNVTGESVGDCQVLANQAGNNNYNAATQVSQTFAVSKTDQTITKVMDYQNEDNAAQIFGTHVADLNGDGLEDVVVSGWAAVPPGFNDTKPIHGKVPVRVLIQQSDATLVDKTSSLIKSGEDMIYGIQRILIADFDSDGKPDIFLPGFQDTGGDHCCPNLPSVMFWNNGSSFERTDFPEKIWNHAACTGDLLNTGRQDIILAGVFGEVYPNNIYLNNGTRNMLVDHSIANEQISSGGACSVMKDPGSGYTAIINTNYYFKDAKGADFIANILIYDQNFRHIKTIGLPGSENPGGYVPGYQKDGTPNQPDLVNIIQIDLNKDGLMDLVLTNQESLKFVALVNEGDFNFINKTSEYFPTNPTVHPAFYTRVINVDGFLSIFIANADEDANWATRPSLWSLTNGSFNPYLQEKITADITGYISPTIYQAKNGTFYLLIAKDRYVFDGPSVQRIFTFYTTPL